MQRLNEADRIAIREMRRSGARLHKIAKTFGCSEAHVSNIVTGKIGSHDREVMEAPPARPMPAVTVQQPGSIIRPVPISMLMGGNARRSHRMDAST